MWDAMLSEGDTLSLQNNALKLALSMEVAFKDSQDLPQAIQMNTQVKDEPMVNKAPHNAAELYPEQRLRCYRPVSRTVPVMSLSQKCFSCQKLEQHAEPSDHGSHAALKTNTNGTAVLR